MCLSQECGSMASPSVSIGCRSDVQTAGNIDLRRLQHSTYNIRIGSPFHVTPHSNGGMTQDNSLEVILEWQARFKKLDIECFVQSHRKDAAPVPGSCGPGYARNVAIAACRGAYLCLLDADDWMMPERITLQVGMSRTACIRVVDETPCLHVP